MKKVTTSLLAISIASMFFYSCSSSKNQGVSGLEKSRNSGKTYSKSSSSYDYKSAQNYGQLAKSYEPSVSVEVKSVETQEQTAVASTEKEFVAIVKKQLPQVEKLNSGNKLSQAEIKNLKSEFKEVQEIVKSEKASAGDKSQVVALILALVVWFLTASIISVHRFYLGGSKNTTAGILQLVFGILTLGIVSSIWGIVDIIRIALGTLKPGSGDYNPKL